MKSQNNSNLTVSEALNLVLNQLVPVIVNNGTNSNADAGNLSNTSSLNVAKKTILGTVTLVTVDEATSIVTIDATLDNNQVITIEQELLEISITPKNGSRILVGFDNDNEPYLVKALDPNIIEIITNDGTGVQLSVKAEDVVKSLISLTSSKIILNTEDYGGLIKIQELTDKLNKLTDDFNALVQKYNAHIHTTTATIGPGPAVGVISPTVSTGSTTSSFNKDDYENLDITHGPLGE